MSTTQVAQPMTDAGVDQLCINTIRTLSMDAVQKANSGHPGTPMALAPVAYCLWQQFLRYDPEDPHWLNRDRFVLSNGHASMLLYAMLHLAGVRDVGENGEVRKELAVPMEEIVLQANPFPRGPLAETRAQPASSPAPVALPEEAGAPLVPNAGRHLKATSVSTEVITYAAK